MTVTKLLAINYMQISLHEASASVSPVQTYNDFIKMG